MNKPLQTWEINEACKKLYYKEPFHFPWKYLLFLANVVLWALFFWAFIVICFSY